MSLCVSSVSKLFVTYPRHSLAKYADYNTELQNADKTSTVVGAALVVDGGKDVATGLSVASPVYRNSSFRWNDCSCYRSNNCWWFNNRCKRWSRNGSWSSYAC